MEYFFVIFFIVLGLATLKNYLTFRHRNEVIEYIFKQPNWQELSEEYFDNTTYIGQFFNPLIWTYKQYFPNLPRL